MASVRVALVSMMVLAACGGDDGGGPPEAPPALVEVTAGRTGALTSTRTYLGIVRSQARAELAAQVGGVVREVNVREGDHVDPDMLLARVDPDLAAADVSAAQAAAQRSDTEQAQAAADAERLARAGSRIVSEIEIRRAQAQAEALAAQRAQSRAALTRARETLRRTRIVAPFAGVITSRRADPGDWVSPGAVLVELVSDQDLEILVRVEPEILDAVEVGHPATLRQGPHEAPASVVGVVRALDPGTRSAQLRLRSSGDPPPWLLAGAAVDVTISIERDGDGLVLPRDAIVPGVAGDRVVRVVDGQAQSVPVEVVARSADEVRVVAEGLAPTDRFVTRGNDRLRPGQPVRVAPAARAEGEAPSEPDA